MPSFAPQAVFQLHPDTSVSAADSAVEELWRVRLIECTDVNLNISLILFFPDSLSDPPAL
jgi:hypothetical protein